ncbi:MAG: amidohydrolase family protein [Alphaproteobacteria bacterium]|nr:amidohydrolase family protein [Alphaproteobacteria bacterium]
MKPVLPGAAAAAALVLVSSPVLAADYAIVHAGRLLAVPGKSVLKEQTVVIKDGRIAAVTPGYIDARAAGASETDTVRVYDLTRKFVLPGLIDGHVHLESELSPRSKLEAVEKSDAAITLDMLDNARKELMAGFTTVRDLGAGDEIFAVRDAINAGRFAGARIFAAGPLITPTGGHGAPHGYREDILETMPHYAVCNGADDCRRAVREAVSRGADQIKFTATGGVLSETAAGTGVAFYDDEMRAIIETAHMLGRRVTAHAHGTNGVNAALHAGVDSIEHGTFSDDESFRLFKKHSAYLVPTILAGVTVTEMATPDDTFMPPAVRKKALAVGPHILDMVRRAHKAGVKIAFGTDTGVSKHGQNAREFPLLVKAGLSPMEAIEAATVNDADNMGQSANIGSIAPGKFGDLVAVDGDPLADINELLDVDFVMKEGVVYKSK